MSKFTLGGCSCTISLDPFNGEMHAVIIYCPLHAAAKAMYEALQKTCRILESSKLRQRTTGICFVSNPCPVCLADTELSKAIALAGTKELSKLGGNDE